MSSLEAFISGKCAVTSSGVLVPNSNPVERRRADENSLDTLSMASSTTSRRRSRDPPTSADDNITSNNTNSSSSSSSNDTNIILAERTSNLISSYRDYVSGLDGYDIEELMISRDAPPALSSSSSASLNSTTASPRRTISNHQNNLREYAPSRNESPPPLLRGWNHNTNSGSSSNGNNNSPNQYSNYTSSAMSNRCDYEPYEYDEENNIPFDNYSEEKKYHYTHPIYHSKKFKRSVFACVLVAIVVIISWVSSSASSSSKAHQKDAQLEDALKHYEIMSPMATSSSNINNNSTAALVTEEVTKPAATKAQDDASSNEDLEALTRHILCCSSSPSSSSSSSSISVETEYLLAESHHPVWYTRSDGWMGTTWQEAREFCSSRGSSSDNTDTIVELCPYEVYCPTGPHHIPYGGYRVETPSSSSVTNSRAPISDFPNGWVQVGSENACVQYSSVGGSSSSSSTSTTTTTTHDEEDAVAMIEEVVHEEVVNTVNESVQNDNESQGVVTIVENESKTDDVTSTTDSQVVTSTDATDATATNINQSFDMTSTLHRKFKPFWLSSKDGWNGGSYDDAVEFCSSIRGKQLCPYSVMCPHGPQQFVMGGYRRVEFEVEGEQYAPILGGENHWVMIGNMEHDGEIAKCMTHRQLEGKAPEWGLNEERQEVKKYIMCCTIN